MRDEKLPQWIRDYQDASCRLFQVDCPELEDYPGRSDLVMGFSVIPQLWEEGDKLGHTETSALSSAGEAFYYIKIDGSEPRFGGSTFADREDIEEALDEILSEAKIGCVIGAGTGRRYSYIDVALTDFDTGRELICQALREVKLTKRSWIIPFDPRVQPNWVCVWEDGPPPPMD
jgi:hypothetical protein